MTFSEALAFYKSNQAIGEALGLSASRVSQLKTSGGFSYPLQCVLEKASRGILLARKQDDPAYPDHSTSAA